jgi:hypothetical protein
MNVAVFWDLAPCSPVEIDRRFRGVYYIHHHPKSPKQVYFNETTRRYIPQHCHHDVSGSLYDTAAVIDVQVPLQQRIERRVRVNSTSQPIASTSLKIHNL